MNYTMRGKTFDELSVGEEIASPARTVTEADVMSFAGLTGDYQPEHINEEFARTSPFGQRIAHGILTLAMATGLINQTGITEGTNIAVIELNVRFVKAVKFGDTIRAVMRIKEKRETKKPDRGIVLTEATVFNQHDEPVLEGGWTLMLRRSEKKETP
jgi:acyl dehydratase